MTLHLRSSRYEYKLEANVLGQGSYGQVRKATCLATQEVYACKTIKATGQHDGKAERVSVPMGFDPCGQAHMQAGQLLKAILPMPADAQRKARTDA